MDDRSNECSKRAKSSWKQNTPKLFLNVKKSNGVYYWGILMGYTNFASIKRNGSNGVY